MKDTKYIVKTTTQFKKDFKLVKKRGLKMELLREVITVLAMGETLPEKNKDHVIRRQNKRVERRTRCATKAIGSFA